MKRFVLSNPQGVLEHVYNLESGVADWLRAITSALDPFMDGGNGTLGAILRFRGPSAIGDLQHHQADEEIPAFHQFIAGLRAMRAAGGTGFDQLFSERGMGTLRTNVGAGPTNFFLEAFKRDGVSDAAGLIVPTRDESSVLFFTARQRETQPVPIQAKSRWIQLQRHIGAVYDLRTRLAEGSPAEMHSMWFDTNGRCVDRGLGDDADVRDRLRDAVRTYEASRSARREAQRVDLQRYWTSVLSGQWVILDRFDSDGRRFIVALPVSQLGDTIRGLSHREREILDLVGDGLSNKAIAFELGVSTTAISTHVSNIFRKLGIDDRASAVRLVRTMRDSTNARLSA